PECAAHLGAVPSTPSACSFSRSWRRDRARWRELGRLPARILSSGHGAVADVPGLVPALLAEGVRRWGAELFHRPPPPSCTRHDPARAAAGLEHREGGLRDAG